jgi:hypothetical protein
MPIQLCTRIFDDGHTCGSPALRGERLCYYHHPSRAKPASTSRTSRRGHRGFVITPPKNRRELQHVLGQILQRLGANQIDPKRASVLLYTLQLAAQNLPG